MARINMEQYEAEVQEAIKSARAIICRNDALGRLDALLQKISQPPAGAIEAVRNNPKKI